MKGRGKSPTTTSRVPPHTHSLTHSLALSLTHTHTTQARTTSSLQHRINGGTHARSGPCHVTGPVTLGPPRLVVVVPLTDGPAASRKTTNPIRNCTRSSPVRAVDGVQSACVSCEGGGERSGAVPAGSRSPQTASCQEVFFPRQQRRLLGRQDTWRELGLLEPGTVRAPGAWPRGQGGGSGGVADCLNSAASPWRDWFYFVFLMAESPCIAPWGGTRIGRGGGGASCCCGLGGAARNAYANLWDLAVGRWQWQVLSGVTGLAG